MYDNVRYYARFYQEFALEQWASLGPTEYGILLISVGVFGWLLMKNGTR